MEKNSKLAVFGASGLVGTALVAELQAQGHNFILAPTHKELDLLDPVAVRWWFSCYEPSYVFLLAARVGGIQANIDDPLGFFLDNINIEQNVMREAVRYDAKKLLFLGSSCVYPEACPNPIKEEDLLTGPFTPEVEAYGLAKVCGIRLCQWARQCFGRNFISAMPCNLFGENDTFDAHSGHCVPGLLARMDEAKATLNPQFTIWGSGTQKRELLYAPDLAKMLVFLMNHYDLAAPINVGSGFELSIGEIAEKIAYLIDYRGTLITDLRYPEGKKQKVLDNTKIRSLMGDSYQLTNFDDALRRTYWDYLKQIG